MGFRGAGRGGTAHVSPPHPHGHTWNRPLTLSPAPGRAGQRKRFSCGRHRCRFSGPRWSRTWPGTKRPAATVRPTHGGYPGRRGGGGGGPAHLGPPPRSTACVSVRPRLRSTPSPLPHSPAPEPLLPSLITPFPAVYSPSGDPPPHGPAPCPSSSWLRPSLVSGFQLCPRDP